MGFFSRFNEAMNEEFILGKDNVERVRNDPGALEEILHAQRARGFGSPRQLRQHARKVRKLEQSARPRRQRGKSRVGSSPKEPSRLWRVFTATARFTGIALLCILIGAWWAGQDRKCNGNGNGNGGAS